MSSTNPTSKPGGFLARISNLVMLLVLAWLVLGVFSVGGLALMQTPHSGSSITLTVATVAAIDLALVLLAAANPAKARWILALSVSAFVTFAVYVGSPTKPSGVYSLVDFIGAMCAAAALSGVMLFLRSSVKSGEKPVLAADGVQGAGSGS